MSRIYFHGQHHESALLGSERAYMGVRCTDIAVALFGSLLTDNRFLGLVPGDHWIKSKARVTVDDIRIYLGSFEETQLAWGGQTHYSFDVVLNTIVQTASPYLALLARLHGTCELHGWVAEEDREWLADVIGEGRGRSIFRANAGWESVAAHLRNGDGGPVVTSYSVCDSFPSAPSTWADGYEDDVAEARWESWYELPDPERWRLAFAGLADRPGLQITPENLTTPTFSAGATLWQAIESDEYRGPTP